MWLGRLCPPQMPCRFRGLRRWRLKRGRAVTGRVGNLSRIIFWATVRLWGGRYGRIWRPLYIVNSAAIGDLTLVSSASLVQAVASSIQGSRGPSASRRQWSACVLYVSASSSKRSASIWFMTEVSQRQPPPLLGHGSIPVKGLRDIFGVMMVEIVLVSAAVSLERL